MGRKVGLLGVRLGSVRLAHTTQTQVVGMVGGEGAYNGVQHVVLLYKGHETRDCLYIVILRSRVHWCLQFLSRLAIAAYRCTCTAAPVAVVGGSVVVASASISFVLIISRLKQFKSSRMVACLPLVQC